METMQPHAIPGRLRTLERRIRFYQGLLIALGLSLVIGFGMAMRTGPLGPHVIRATRLDVVNEAGQVVFSAGLREGKNDNAILLRNNTGELGFAAYASERGGRLEMFNQMGQDVFSAGLPLTTDMPGLWERQIQDVERQRTEIHRQGQDIDRLGRRMDRLEQLDSTPPAATDGLREWDRHSRELDRQGRELNQLSRQVNDLRRQIQSLERR